MCIVRPLRAWRGQQLVQAAPEKFLWCGHRLVLFARPPLCIWIVFTEIIQITNLLWNHLLVLWWLCLVPYCILIRLCWSPENKAWHNECSLGARVRCGSIIWVGSVSSILNIKNYMNTKLGSGFRKGPCKHGALKLNCMSCIVSLPLSEAMNMIMGTPSGWAPAFM